MQEKRVNIIAKYLTYGLIVGVVLRVISIIIELSLRNDSINLNSFLQLHIDYSSTYFFDFLPVVLLGIIGYLVGELVFRTKYKLSKIIVKDKNRFETVYDFIENIRQGNAEFEYNFVEEGELEDALINLRKDLLESKEKEEKRKKEEQQRHWTSEGLAKFGAILRDTSDNLDELSSTVISEFVKYIDAKQAGFFIINDDDEFNPYIEQIAGFAYGRKKFTDKKIEWSEGLVGACILEKETIFIDKVSENYVEITSGLGKSNPRSILIVPLKTEEGLVHGAIEFASFKIYEQFEIDFVEQVAESIATTITTLKSSMQTEKLLKDSMQQADELTKQEEKMRITVDEMRELQMEAAKQSEEFISFTNSVNHTLIRAEYSIDGVLKYANTKFLSILGYTTNSEVEGRSITDFINEKDQVWFDEIWQRITSGGKHFEGDMKHVAKNGKEVWTIATYVSVRDKDGIPEKILFLGIDTTEAKKQSLDYEGQINALNNSSIKAEFTTNGDIVDMNQKFLNSLKYSEDAISGKNIFSITPKSDKEKIKGIWEQLKNGNHFEGRIRMVDSSKELIWLYGTFSIVRDMYGDIAKIIFIGNDITLQHKIEIQNKEQTKKLQEQEEKLQESKVQLSLKLKQAREEMKQQFREIETVKLLHDKTLEGMLDIIITINQDNKIEFFNKAAEELWGIDKNDILNKEITELLPDEYKDMGGEYLGEYFKANLEKTLVNTRMEVYIVNKEGEQVFVLMTLSEAGIGLRYNLTAFIQQIEVELF